MRPAKAASRLLQTRALAIAGLPAWAEVIRGSLVRYYLTCGKKSCRCHRSRDNRHGPYWYVSVPAGKGRNKSYLVAHAQVADAKRGTAAYKKLWKELCRISDANLALLRAGAWRSNDPKRARK